MFKKTNSLFFIDKFLNEFPKAELYLVGGAVRDLLLKRKNKELDFDFVIRNLNKKSIENFLAKNGKVQLVGKNFGVYKFMPKNISTPFIDIALPRKEATKKKQSGGYKDFNVMTDATLSITDDLSRRDFTINAMAFNIKTNELIDPFKGTRDLKKKLIRAVGNPSDRFKEDYSRMLRALRFACELNFEIEKKTFLAIKKNIASINKKRRVNNKLQFIVPREIVGAELAKMIYANPQKTFELLQETKILDLLFTNLRTSPRNTKMLGNIKNHRVSLFIILLLKDLTQKDFEKTVKLTGLSTLSKSSSRRIEIGQIKKIIERLNSGLLIENVKTMKASRFEKWFFNGNGNLLLSALDLTGQKHITNAAQKRKHEIQKRWNIEEGDPIPPLLSGDDVLSAGTKAGPKVRIILDKARDKQLDGDIMNRASALAWLKKNTDA